MSKKIVIIDDERCCINMYERMLRQSGYELSLHDDPNEVIKIIANGETDLLITDYIFNRLDFNGVTLIEKCRALSAKTKFLMISGTILTSHNADLLLEKTSISKDLLLNRIRQLIS